MTQYGLSPYDADSLTQSREVAEYFEAVTALTNDAKLTANWMNGDVAAALNRAGLEINAIPVTTEALASLLKRIQDNTISGKIAKEVFDALWNGEGTTDEIIEKKGLKQITDSSAIEGLIDGIIAANPKQVEEYRSGKDKLFGFFVGQAMKASKGKANPEQLNAILKQKLEG